MNEGWDEENKVSRMQNPVRYSVSGRTQSSWDGISNLLCVSLRIVPSGVTHPSTPWFQNLCFLTVGDRASYNGPDLGCLLNPR